MFRAFPYKKFVSLSVAVLSVLGYGAVVFSAQLSPGTVPPSGGYLFGDSILDPGCAPGSSNCFQNTGDGVGWGLTGNAGTDGGTTNFVGTTDAADFVIKTNNSQMAKFGQIGNIALGTASTASQANSFAIGNGAVTSEANEIMLGQNRLAVKSNGFIFNSDSFNNNTGTTIIVGPTTNPINFGSFPDVGFEGPYTGSSITDVYAVIIEPSGTDYTFTLNGVTVSTGNPINAGVPDLLQDGVYVTFVSSNYIDGEKWQMTPVTQFNEEQKFFFNYDQKAIRLGSVNGSLWQGGNIGNRSVAIGFADNDRGLDAPIASGLHSVALGSGTISSGDFTTVFGSGNNASGDYAVAFGYNTDAVGRFTVAFGTNTYAGDDGSVAFGVDTDSIGIASTAFGFATTASSTGATAFGISSTASADASTAFGTGSVASNENATAFGQSTLASGSTSTAFGSGTVASGQYATAMGQQATASGKVSTAIGYRLSSKSFAEVSVGLSTTNYTPFDPLDFDARDRLFVVGNGVGTGSDSDALTILKNGKVGIGINNFENTNNQIDDGSALLQVDGKIFATGVITQSLNISSDQRLKQNISSSSYGLQTINSLRPVTYRMISDGSPQIGFIAQEVRTVLPDLVTEGKYLSLNYTGIIPVLTKAVQELDIKISSIQGIGDTSSLASRFADMVLHVKSIVFGTPETPSGFTMYDTVSHLPYCVTLANGDFVKTAGECGTAVIVPAPSPAPEPDPVPEPELQPVEPTTEGTQEVVPPLENPVIDTPVPEETPTPAAPAEEPETPLQESV